MGEQNMCFLKLEFKSISLDFNTFKLILKYVSFVAKYFLAVILLIFTFP